MGCGLDRGHIDLSAGMAPPYTDDGYDQRKLLFDGRFAFVLLVLGRKLTPGAAG
jgi:hypothetical protein